MDVERIHKTKIENNNQQDSRKKICVAMRPLSVICDLFGVCLQAASRLESLEGKNPLDIVSPKL